MEHKWDQIAKSDQFRTLLSKKRRFIVPAVIFFIIYYISLPVAAGYLKDLMRIKVIGSLNVAYLLALSQFLMAWIIAALYLRAANGFDALAEQVVRGARAVQPSHPVDSD